MKRYSLIFIFTLFVRALFAQADIPHLPVLQEFLRDVNRQQVGLSETKNNIAGSQYLSDDFCIGKIDLEGVRYDSIQMRFDMYFGYFELKLKEDKIAALNPLVASIDTIHCQNEKFVRRRVNDKIEFMALLLSQENISLCKKYGARIQEAQEAQPYGAAKPAEFKKNKVKYYLFDEANYAEIKDAKSVASYFNMELKELKKVLKSNKCKLNKESDLVHTINHLLNL